MCKFHPGEGNFEREQHPPVDVIDWDVRHHSNWNVPWNILLWIFANRPNLNNPHEKLQISHSKLIESSLLWNLHKLNKFDLKLEYKWWERR
jgi:hypothetical protein